MCGITYVWTLKHDPNDTIYETESRTQRLVFAKGEENEGEGWIGHWGLADAN